MQQRPCTQLTIDCATGPHQNHVSTITPDAGRENLEEMQAASMAEAKKLKQFCQDVKAAVEAPAPAFFAKCKEIASNAQGKHIRPDA